jgi:hypothetical protein
MVIARVFAEHAARFWRSRCFVERLPDGEPIALFYCVGIHQKENDNDANRDPPLPLSSERRDRHYLVVIREGKTLKGRVLDFVVRTIGWGVWERVFGNSVKAIEGHKGSVRKGIRVPEFDLLPAYYRQPYYRDCE